MAEATLIEMKGVDNSLQAWSTDGRLAIAREPFGEIITFDRSFPDTPLAEANVMGRIIGSQLLQWSPDDRKIAFVAEDGEIRVVDGERLGAPEEWRKAIHTGTLHAVAWSPNGSRLVTGGDDRAVRIWDTRTGEEVLSIRGSANSIRALAWSPDGKWIASGELGGMIRIWNAKEDSRPPTIQADPPLSVNTLEWNPKTEQVAISANQSWIYSAHVLDVAARRLVNTPEGAVKSVAWHPDGKRIAAAHLDGGEDLLKVSDLESGEDLWGEGPGSWHLAWTPDGRRLAAMHSEGYLNIYRGQDGTLLQKIEAPSGNQRTTRPTHQFRFSPDGGTLAWGQKTGNIALINPETGEAERVLKGHSARVGAVDWSGDGERIASASEDHTIRIWDFSSASVLVELIGHSSAVMDVQWSPDESRLATASLDGTVRLWNSETGQEVARFPCSGAMRAVDWSPDGTRLITGGDEGLRLFDARKGYREEALDRFYGKVENGDWNAAAELGEAILSRLTDEQGESWLQTGWWKQRSAPDLGKPPAPTFGNTLVGHEKDLVDLELYLGKCQDRTIWMATRVFSPREQKAGLQVPGPGVRQVWRDGAVVLEAPTGEVLLNEGWITFQVRISDWRNADSLSFVLFSGKK